MKQATARKRDLMRAWIDHRLKPNNMRMDQTIEDALEELARLFHSTGVTECKVCPITREAVAARRASVRVW